MGSSALSADATVWADSDRDKETERAQCVKGKHTDRGTNSLTGADTHTHTHTHTSHA